MKHKNLISRASRTKKEQQKPLYINKYIILKRDDEKIINRLNRKYDKHIRKVKGGINENNNNSKQ